MKLIGTCKNKTWLLSALVLSVFSSAFAERAPVYISPNNDGVKDALEVPVQIKERRYVTEWTFTIFNDKGEVVRTIGNKEKRTGKLTVKTFFKALFSVKEGVTVPSTVVWNGFFDDGSLAPDGLYYYQLSASDDNGNTASTEKYMVIVDNEAPRVVIQPLTEQEKSFGEGSKAHLHIQQEGSEEDLWVAPITNAEGKTVRTFRFENSAPISLDWDGTDEDGMPVPDGVYTYNISATDRAGNVSEKAQVSNIIYSAEKPQTNIAIVGSRYFSPNGDNVLDTMNFSVSIPSPESSVNVLTAWKIAIVNKDTGTVYRTYEGSTNPPTSIVFDGRNESGALIPEGEYHAQVTARYLNGYEPLPVNSPVFVMNITAPTATVSTDTKTFSPDGDGNLDVLTIQQRQTSAERAWAGRKNWTGRIVNANGTIVKQFDFGASIPDKLVWDGIDDTGALASDGDYRYELSVTEPAGNIGKYETSSFTLDTSKTELVLTCTPSAFSPNGDRVQDTVTLTPVAKTASGVESYVVSVLDKNGKSVKRFSGSGALPRSIVWDGHSENGKLCADGVYSATLSTKAQNGSEATTSTQPFVLDTKAPEIKLSVPYNVFSPDGVSSRQKIPVAASSSKETEWHGKIVRSTSSNASSAVKTFTWNGNVTDFDWDGTDDSGNIVSNGTYSLTVSTTDAAGNSGQAIVNDIVVDTREAKIYITTELEGISPNGDGVKDSQKFTVRASLTEGISAWRFSIVGTDGATVRQWTEKDIADLPATLVWNGDTSSGAIAEGIFTGQLHVEYTKGNVVDATSTPFVCTATPPVLSVRTTPRYFSPDNDGNDDDLFIQLKGETLANLQNWSFVINDPQGQPFWKTGGKSSITEQIIWDGRGNNGELVQSAMDYPYEFTVSDDLGMTSTVTGVISIDVLVIRVGNVLKMQVPSIIFRSDNADFGLTGEKDANGRVIKNGISEEQKRNNERVLKRIAEILKKFGEYKVTVVGHANRLTDNSNEEIIDNPREWGPALIPLSEARAGYVKQYLVSAGISADRLSVQGKGGTEPVADTKERAVNWKNRRVEFILEK